MKEGTESTAVRIVSLVSYHISTSTFYSDGLDYARPPNNLAFDKMGYWQDTKMRRPISIIVLGFHLVFELSRDHHLSIGYFRLNSTT